MISTLGRDAGQEDQKVKPISGYILSEASLGPYLRGPRKRKPSSESSEAHYKGPEELSQTARFQSKEQLVFLTQEIQLSGC